jgi:hypothetical protein
MLVGGRIGQQARTDDDRVASVSQFNLNLCRHQRGVDLHVASVEAAISRALAIRPPAQAASRLC